MEKRSCNGKKPELLAPAGNYDCFLAAIGAGADAVYLAGERFGARAFADNFSGEELLAAIRYAHLFSRKVYMAVNILFKDRETEELGAYLAPYVRAGLDAVIVQDLGALSLIRKEFPDLAVHCSTQMTLTTSAGVRFAKELGARRVVPARELTLKEIRQIKKQCPDMELECFVHGAMCYCYSGQCLLSSMLGARSGNRGRCAQPCRLPYEVIFPEKAEYTASQKEQAYPLSLKDLSALSLIPELIGAGIDSFKIEGRMKSPEYCAGVTSVYRAVIDRYFEDPRRFAGPTREECGFLEKLYVRGDVGEGYFHRRNGKEMITAGKGGYRGCDEAVLKEIRERYIRRPLSLPVRMRIVLRAGQEAELSVSCQDVTVSCLGDIAEESKSRPLTEENVRTQLGKTGGTVFEAVRIDVEQDKHIFYALGKLNELRRCALAKLEVALSERGAVRSDISAAGSEAYTAKIQRHPDADDAYTADRCRYTVSVTTLQQLAACLAHPLPKRLIVDADLFEQYQSGRICMPDGADSGELPDKRFLLAMPRILREQDLPVLREKFLKTASFREVSGIWIHTPDAYALARDVAEKLGKDPRGFLYGSPFLYQMNTLSARFWAKRIAGAAFSYELHEKEFNALARNAQKMGIPPLTLPVYGHIPVMVTANCLAKSFAKEGCVRGGGLMYLKDRTGRQFPVIRDCQYCCNTIYNGIALSLHKYREKLSKLYDEGMIGSFLLSFITEDAEKVKALLDFYADADAPWGFGEYTNGHFQKGVD